MSLDEVEAIRLADYEGRYHEEAARKMKISRATFGRIVKEARRKVAEALTRGKALKIEQSEAGLRTQLNKNDKEDAK